MSVKINLGSFRANFNHLSGRIEQQTKKALLDIAKIAEGASVDRAPLKEGFLSSDIEGVYAEEGGKQAAVIRVPANATSSPYAIKMHEGYYNLGPGSSAKQARTGNIIGREYILRGILDSRPDIVATIKKNMGV